MSRNRQKQAKRAKEDIERERTRGQTHAQAQATQFSKDGSLKREYIESLTETSLNQGTIKLLDNMVTRDWVLSNLKDAEVEEAKWRIVELAKVEVLNMHPRRGSQVTGARRAFMLNDDMEQLQPLTEREKNTIENFLHAVFFGRLTRSRGGWQQEQMSKTISVSEMRDKREEQKDGLMAGIFGG